MNCELLYRPPDTISEAEVRDIGGLCCRNEGHELREEYIRNCLTDKNGRVVVLRDISSRQVVSFCCFTKWLNREYPNPSSFEHFDSDRCLLISLVCSCRHKKPAGALIFAYALNEGQKLGFSCAILDAQPSGSLPRLERFYANFGFVAIPSPPTTRPAPPPLPADGSTVEQDRTAQQLGFNPHYKPGMREYRQVPREGQQEQVFYNYHVITKRSLDFALLTPETTQARLRLP